MPTRDASTLDIFVRAAAARSGGNSSAPALVLEGDWPDEMRSPARDSLDRLFDARHGWIDRQAGELAERLAFGADEITACDAEFPTSLLACLGALRLRYFLVKLLRWTAYCREVRPPRPGESWRLHAGSGDEDYVALFHALRHAYNVQGTVVNAATGSCSASQKAATIPAWRLWLTPFVAHTTESQVARLAAASRTLFVGDSRLLEPLCTALRERGRQVAWLSDEPVLRTRLRTPWATQLVCEGRRASRNRFGIANIPSLRTDDGIELARPVAAWLERVRSSHGARWTRWLMAIDRHLRNDRPETLILSEDATPFARAAVWTARRLDIRSVVVQHGAPAVRFGFAPLFADEFAAWDEPSRQQLIDWGVEPERIAVTGSLALERSKSPLQIRSRRSASRGPKTVLLLASLPARDDRPDAVEYHLTTSTYTKMLRDAVSAIDALGGVRLIVKLHPRQTCDAAWRETLREYPALKATIVRRGPWTRWLAEADAVVSCGSSAGMEAVHLGWPVVQLLPAGSSNILAAPDWGFVGTAQNATQLNRLLRHALRQDRRAVDACVGDNATANLCHLLETPRPVNSWRPAPDSYFPATAERETTPCLRT